MRKHPIRFGAGRLFAVAIRPWAAMARKRRIRRHEDELARLSDLALRDLGLDRCAVHRLACMAGTRRTGGAPPWTEPAQESWEGLRGDPTSQARG
jgi:uncharacterized protein YjiS (DUF1127 family)